MAPKLLSAILIWTLVLCCRSGENEFVNIGIGTFTTLRIMTTAANHIGVSLHKEIAAYKQVSANVYRITFLGRQKTGDIIRCNAEVDETIPFSGKVTKYRCVATY